MFKGISSDQEQQQQLEKARKVQLLPGRVDREGHYRVHPSSPAYIFQLSVFLFQRWEFQDVAVECEKTLNTDFGQGKSSQHLQTCFFHSTLHICVYIYVYICALLSFHLHRRMKRRYKVCNVKWLKLSLNWPVRRKLDKDVKKDPHLFHHLGRKYPP